MAELSQNPALTVRCQIARRPDGRSADVTSKNGVLCGQLINDFGNVLWMNWLLSGDTGGQIIQPFARLLIVLETLVEVISILLGRQLRRKCLQRCLHIAD